ncbi:hypothetical protein P170DRAFT_219454 [Aspergillus steynii IBT 23096]|uniref:RING-type domain-containing protein n=1 Tax=Aspergillus steynii IBT 23096 TaxID=1392250 RepID=A0A2I2G1E6_9EURO|nr:uncharacterized protein P170DRAFT_219454 [Aspergillus steynii IBT 23096]PLB46701.1 hypothetical protein P170DRAFT_219454 [Aspergillus steynii IBT 23096]
MAAASLTTAASLFTGPEVATNNTPLVNDSATFRLALDGTVQTLSTQNAPDKGPIKGLFFVPGLDDSDPCTNATAQYVPANVTRFEDVKTFGYRTVGLAPWISADCTQSFLDSSRRVGTNALVFFIPSSNDTKPPAEDSSVWSLRDREWKRRNKYPVYAIPGPAGATIMRQLSWYSGNPNRSHNDSTEFLQEGQGETRLFALINIDKGGKKMPSLWGFILAIVGTVLVLSVILLLCYQIVQKRRRESLQRRIEAGEADIEHLGLHQVKVSQEILDTFPVYAYPDLEALSDRDVESRSGDGISMQPLDKVEEEPEESHTESETQIRTDEAVGDIQKGGKEAEEQEVCPNQRDDISASSERQTPTTAPFFRNRLSHSQTTCAICLDDFVPNVAIVRELPCGHIFHVECIDTSLDQNSSLCPLCKKNVVPPGSYPVPVTNRMVHLDYMLRRTTR